MPLLLLITKVDIHLATQCENLRIFSGNALGLCRMLFGSLFVFQVGMSNAQTRMRECKLLVQLNRPGKRIDRALILAHIQMAHARLVVIGWTVHIAGRFHRTC